MKTKTPEIDLDQELTLEYVPAFQSGTFTVTGDSENVLPLAEAVQAEEKAKPNKVASVAVKAAVAAPERPQAVYTEPTRRERIARYMADAKLRRFDRTWDTDLYARKQEQRRKTAIFLMASEADLFDNGSAYYKAQLNRLAKAGKA